MTNEELQALTSKTALDLRDQGIEGCVVVTVNGDIMAIGSVVPDFDLDFMIGCVVQMLGALRDASVNGPPPAPGEEPQSPPPENGSSN